MGCLIEIDGDNHLQACQVRASLRRVFLEAGANLVGLDIFCSKCGFMIGSNLI